MSRTARAATALGVAACIALAPACRASPDGKTATPAAATAALEGTRWRLVELDGQTVSMPSGADDPYIQLLGATHRIEGFAGCNRIMGGYELDGQTLRFPGIAASRKYCDSTAAIEQAFLTALSATGSFRVVGNRLELRGDTTTVARLEAW